MNTGFDKIKAILQQIVSVFLGMPFTLKEYSDSEDCDSWEVYGVIRRYNTSVNVQVTVSKNGPSPKYWRITDDAVTLKNRFIGQIRLSHDVIVSDPCYSRDVWCMTKLTNVKPGIWKVNAAVDTIDSWGERCYVLELWHKDVDQEDEPDWVNHFELGVDSGTMSVFDDAYYNRKNGSVEEFESDNAAKEAFREKCFKLADNYAGIYHSDGKAIGIVCSSGCGDGGYPLYIIEENGEIVAMKISFM